MPSPALLNKEGHFQYPSPPGSPKHSRPRSQTLGTLSDTGLLSKKLQEVANLVKKEKIPELQDPPKRRNSMNSPMKQM